MADTDLEIAPFLSLMVKKDGEDIYFHSGAKILIKGPFGFAWLGEKLVPGQVDRIFRSVASDRKIMEFEEHGEVDFSLGVQNLGRFRGSAFRQRGETSLVFRYVRGEIPTTEELGLPTVLKDLVMEKNGLVVVVGATGSGKSTTATRTPRATFSRSRTRSNSCTSTSAPWSHSERWAWTRKPSAAAYDRRCVRLPT